MKPRGNNSRSQSRSTTVIRQQGSRVCRAPKTSKNVPHFPRPAYVVKPVPRKKTYNKAKNTAPSVHTISFNLPSQSNAWNISHTKRKVNKKAFKKKTPLKPIRSSVRSKKSRNVSRCTSTVGLSKSASSLRSYRFSQRELHSLAFFDVDTTCGKLFSSEGIQADGCEPMVNFEPCKTTVNFESDNAHTVGVVDVDKIRRSYGQSKPETKEKSTEPCSIGNTRTEIFIEKQTLTRPEKKRSRSRLPKLEETPPLSKEKSIKTVICKEKKARKPEEKKEPKKTTKPIEKPKYDAAQDEHLKGHLAQIKPEKRKEIVAQSQQQSASEVLKRIWRSFSPASSSSSQARRSPARKAPVSKWDPQFWTKEQQITAAAIAIFALVAAGLYYFEKGD